MLDKQNSRGGSQGEPGTVWWDNAMNSLNAGSGAIENFLKIATGDARLFLANHIEEQAQQAAASIRNAIQDAEGEIARGFEQVFNEVKVKMGGMVSTFITKTIGDLHVDKKLEADLIQQIQKDAEVSTAALEQSIKQGLDRIKTKVAGEGFDTTSAILTTLAARMRSQ
jgi:effector-binding domain-containing protein